MELNYIRELMEKKAKRAALFAESVRALCAARDNANKLSSVCAALASVTIAIDGTVIALATDDDLTAIRTLSKCAVDLLTATYNIHGALFDSIDENVFGPICETLNKLEQSADKETRALLALMED